ncbi:hypothetical protein BDV93DRAFT_510278 [Ceratobasidium sp. AG-I]|nr:hypothetical protein BDV93DRAFT_510278 [Ceratobasidium sp. AG-I]
MAQAQGILDTHLGNSNSSWNPALLAFQNTILHQKPIPSPTPFHIARDLIQVSLYSRVPHCLLLVSGSSDLATLAKSLSDLDLAQASQAPHLNSFSRLEQLAATIYSDYASSTRVYTLRRERKSAENPTNAGDMIFEDSSLFLRDSLQFQGFIGAIKAGDSGRVLLSLKQWAFSFRANGRHKYAHEMLDIILNNWIPNPTGNPNSHVELDLVQEHLIYWIKTIYKAHGSNASWEWLASISPCVDFLRRLTKEFHRSLGDDQGISHSPADLKKSIHTLMRSFATNETHSIKNGRHRAEGDGKPVRDILTEGMSRLVHGANGPRSRHYNVAFRGQHSHLMMASLVRVAGTRQTPSPTLPDQLCDEGPADVSKGSDTTRQPHRTQDQLPLSDRATKTPGLEGNTSRHEGERLNDEDKPVSETSLGLGLAPETELEDFDQLENEADESSESESSDSSYGSSETSATFDLEFELGDELGQSLLGLDDEQENEVECELSDGGSESVCAAGSDADSLLDGL